MNGSNMTLNMGNGSVSGIPSSQAHPSQMMQNFNTAIAAPQSNPNIPAESMANQAIGGSVFDASLNGGNMGAGNGMGGNTNNGNIQFAQQIHPQHPIQPPPVFHHQQQQHHHQQQQQQQQNPPPQQHKGSVNSLNGMQAHVLPQSQSTSMIPQQASNRQQQIQRPGFQRSATSINKLPLQAHQQQQLNMSAPFPSSHSPAAHSNDHTPQISNQPQPQSQPQSQPQPHFIQLQQANAAAARGSISAPTTAVPNTNGPTPVLSHSQQHTPIAQARPGPVPVPVPPHQQPQQQQQHPPGPVPAPPIAGQPQPQQQQQQQQQHPPGPAPPGQQPQPNGTMPNNMMTTQPNQDQQRQFQNELNTKIFRKNLGNAAVMRILDLIDQVSNENYENLSNFDYWQRITQIYFIPTSILRFTTAPSSSQQQQQPKDDSFLGQCFGNANIPPGVSRQFELSSSTAPRFFLSCVLAGNVAKFNVSLPGLKFQVMNNESIFIASKTIFTFNYKDGSTATINGLVKLLMNREFRIEWIDIHCLSYQGSISFDTLENHTKKLSTNKNFKSSELLNSIYDSSDSIKNQVNSGLNENSMKVMQIGDTMSHLRSLMAFTMVNNINSPLKAMDLFMTLCNNQRNNAQSSQQNKNVNSPSPIINDDKNGTKKRKMSQSNLLDNKRRN